tara:strand:- start:541 stop:1425 length:885 start_codon:yes stop_codon:yes gene_type:complete
LRKRVFELCPVCDSNEFEVLGNMKSPVLPKLGGVPISICKKCGFITMNPKPHPNFAFECNQVWFQREVNDSPDETSRWEKFWTRIENTVDLSSVLDIGSRHGNALLFLKDKFPGLNCKAVEAVDEFKEILINNHDVDAESFDIASSWPDRFQGFDLVICRMVLEHLDRPVETLENIKSSLSDLGLVYVSVPNSMNIRNKQPITRDYFRPIHAHYFNIYTLILLMQKCGLHPVLLGNEGDAWGLFGKHKVNIDMPDPISYRQQKNFILKRIRSGKYGDYKIAAKMIARRVLRKEA